METPYLDDAIKRHEKALEINMLSDGGKKALIEFKAIKKALRRHDVMALLPSADFNEFRLAIGLLPDDLSERAKEYFRKAMEEYSKKQLLKFCDHLNTYKGFEDCRFDFMLADFKHGC